jgi:transposase-like protein
MDAGVGATGYRGGTMNCPLCKHVGEDGKVIALPPEDGAMYQCEACGFKWVTMTPEEIERAKQMADDWKWRLARYYQEQQREWKGFASERRAMLEGRLRDYLNKM